MKIRQLHSILKQTPYFTKHNLSLAINKQGEDLNYWIKKLLKEEVLIPLKKGFYVSSYYLDLVKQRPGEFEIYFEYLANRLRHPSYVSLEYVLAKQGFIPEAVFAITAVTTKSTRTYTSKLSRFIYRKIKTELFFGWETKQFKEKTVRIAPLSKAIFDYFYLKTLPVKSWPSYLLEEGRLNWDVLSKEAKDKFLTFVQIANSSKIRNITNILTKEGIL